VIYAVAGPVYTSYRHDASAESTSKSASVYIAADNTSGYGCPEGAGATYISITISVLSLSAAQSTAKMALDLFPEGGFAEESPMRGEVELQANQTLVLWTGRARNTYVDGSVMSRITGDELLVSQGSETNSFYPWDW
jgi:hypothetical protein